MNVEWWINLNSDKKRLLALLFSALIVLGSVIRSLNGQMETLRAEHKKEILEEQKKTLAERKEKEIAQLAQRNAEVDCAKTRLKDVQDLLEEQKKKNDAFERVTKQQGEVINTNRNFVDGTTKIVKEITKTIEPSQQ